MIRLFTAITIPPQIGQGLLPRQAGIEGARWRPLEAFHITLRFVGDVAEDVAADLDEALAQIVSPAFDLELAGAGCFGEGADLHAVWAGVAESAALRQLQKGHERAARAAGLKPESRLYTPHVTLAYLKRPSVPEVGSWLQANNLLRSPAFRVDRFGLYSSWQTREGSAYRLEREYPLGL
ncbi:RNA 2',3'-cyclic phosphodiesterase [Caulobacter vibrioides]|uniref:RNA 2',3'-cyclic phosphodiesterase n=1 Tax=Caulobacter vibrioides TaxID=155892 RepID=A0A290N274_CAUVI|nr:RNA 2',3'-cyclic phosphodiesterase [Caulobacter vibrioides]ATC33703.1 RNA 2',3'-cyclic phosphodiesterase [Caulobacter vibrioides]